MKQSLFNVRVADIADAKNLALLAESTFRRAFEKGSNMSFRISQRMSSDLFGSSTAPSNQELQ